MNGNWPKDLWRDWALFYLFCYSPRPISVCAPQGHWFLSSRVKQSTPRPTTPYPPDIWWTAIKLFLILKILQYFHHPQKCSGGGEKMNCSIREHNIHYIILGLWDTLQNKYKKSPNLTSFNNLYKTEHTSFLIIVKRLSGNCGEKCHVSKVEKIEFVNILDVRRGRNVKSRWLQVFNLSN